MSPQELLERLHTLSMSAGSMQIVFVAPSNVAEARSFVEKLNTDDPGDLRRFDGQVSAQDLREFLRWVTII